jgi:replicative DNA helicase
MHTLIKNEIRNFEALQEKYADMGAEDSEPDYIFQLIIARAIKREAIDFNELIDWELYESPEKNSASDELSTQAMKVYELIQKFAQPEDFEEFKKYCWRIEKAVFTT